MDSIPLLIPFLDDREAQALQRVIKSGWITQGPETAAFESEFAAAVGSPYACAVSNCTTALHLALQVVGVQPGGEVITVSHSFIATANSIRYCQAVPVFVDIDLATYNLDPTRLEHAITPRTQAILCVHQMGMPCDLTGILQFAKRQGLPVVEDAACAIGSEFLSNDRWERLGKPHGDVACFSFHPRKVITTGDGGMLTTANPEYDRRFRLLRQHGMSISDLTRHHARQVVFEEYQCLGYNYRLTDVQAAIGRQQLLKLPEILRRRRLLAARYRELLSDQKDVILPAEPSWARSNWQSFCIRLADQLDQKQVMQSLLEQGVASRRGIMCAHREPAYQEEVWFCPQCNRRPHPVRQPCPHLRHSEKAQDQSIILPLYPQMTDMEQDLVIEALRQACCRVRRPRI